MSSSIKKTVTPWPLIVLFVILSTSSIVAGFLYYRILETHLLNETKEQLSAIADLKVRQIIQWRRERISDGIYLSGNIPHIRQFSRFLTEEGNKRNEVDLLKSLESYVENYDYRNALLVDNEYNVRLFYPDQDTVICEHLQKMLPGVISKEEVIITDLHQTGKVSYFHLDLLVPLKDPDVTDTSVFGVVVLRIDPEKLLFPLIESWPVSSNTAEALLFHVEGDEIVYLNRLRHLGSEGIGMRMPVTENRLPSSMAVQGIKETTDGIDYRGIRVVAAMKKVPGTPWYLVAKIDREEIYASLSDMIGQIVIIIVLIILTSGLFLIFLWWNQRAKYYQSLNRDISERKQAEETLRESEERFRKIFEESPFSMIMTGKDMGIIKANSAFCKMLGYDEEELIGLTFRDFTHPEHITQDELSILRLIAQEIPIYHTEKRYLRKDGSVIWGSTTVNIIHNSKGEVQLFFAMIEDITARKKAEEDLIAAKEKAEESDRLKTAFLHNVSHEIRTPMNAILGFSALLNEPRIQDDERKQFVEVIYQSSSQLLSIINDIVDLASIESGQVRLNIQKINLNDELRKLSEQFSYKQKPHGISLILETPLADRNADILTDSTKLIQILSNLINNAYKFTKKGKINFGYNLKDGFLEFFVKDTGVGIPPEHQDRVFDRFYQVDSALSRQYSGTGLGLSICKAYAELFGGSIWLTSIPNEGSIFSFTIPYKKKEG